jgi:hypothetical protein
VAKYEIWGRKEQGKRRFRLAFGFTAERHARTERERLIKSGFIDVVIVQQPPRYGRIKGLLNAGRDSQKR